MNFNWNSASKTSSNCQEILFIFSYKLPCFSSSNWTFKRSSKLQFKTLKNLLKYSLILQQKQSFLQWFQHSLSWIFVILLPKKCFSTRFFKKNQEQANSLKKHLFKKPASIFLLGLVLLLTLSLSLSVQIALILLCFHSVIHLH